MAKVLVVYGSRHGGTQGIAERIGEVLTSEGLEARVESAEHVRDIGAPDAVVIGSGVYMGRWLDAPVTFVERHAAELASRPVWLFSSGPVPSGSAPTEEADHMEAFGPAEGPGSGGRKKLDELIALTHPRGHKVFLGAFDPDRHRGRRRVRWRDGPSWRGSRGTATRPDAGRLPERSQRLPRGRVRPEGRA
jgi:menaquinone-dependent protoporphyrinogen oxidase